MVIIFNMVILLIALLISLVLSSSLVSSSSSSSSSCSDPLQCLLQYYTITISKIIIPVDDSSIEIDDFICDSLSLSSLSSRYKVLKIFTLQLLLLLLLLLLFIIINTNTNNTNTTRHPLH